MKKDYDEENLRRLLLGKGVSFDDAHDDMVNERTAVFVAAMLDRRRFEQALAAAERFLPDGRQETARLWDDVPDDVKKNRANHNWKLRVDVIAGYRDQIVARNEPLATLKLNRRHCSYKTIADKMTGALDAWRAWQWSRDRFSNLNLGLVRTTAALYRRLAEKYRAQFDELVTSGTAGLMIAIDNFDLERGYAFSTYATHWINREIQDEMRRQAVIKIPRDQAKKLAAMFDFMNGFFAQHGRYPNSDEIEKFAVERGTKKDYRTAAFNASAIASLDESKTDPDGGEGYKLGDMIPGATSLQPDEICMRQEEYALLMNGFSRLQEREKLFLVMRYGISLDADFLGLDDYLNSRGAAFRERAYLISTSQNEASYRDLAELDGNVTRQRVEQIIKNAERKLKDRRGDKGAD